MLAVAHFNGPTTLWDIASRTPFGGPISYSTDLVGVAFSTNAALLITGDEKLNATVAYDLTVKSWIEQACELAGRELTRAERLSYQLPVSGTRTCAALPSGSDLLEKN
jgi:hypothetical protein